MFLIIGRVIENIPTKGKDALQLLKGAVGAAMLAILVAAPYAFTFWMSIQSDSRLVMRDNSLHEQLLRHNAVDPKIYWMWGEFQSVNLKEKYGEPFVHTAYLRWSILPLAVWAGIKQKRLRFGSNGILIDLRIRKLLWWNEDWIYVDDQMLSAPFDWIRQSSPKSLSRIHYGYRLVDRLFVSL